MASLGHVIAGFGGARVHDARFHWKSMVAFAAFALLPDLDVIGFRFGIAYSDPLGHRGASHSIVFAVLVALVGLALTRSRKSTLILFLVVLSHPLLDMLTDGGLGVALFWPFSNQRLFFPWTPLPVAPIGRGMLSARGAYVLLVESLVFAPALVLPVLWARWKGKGAT
ncbi:MAG: metal-dependent hydrolase [Myxococcaceae bacterium]